MRHFKRTVSVILAIILAALIIQPVSHPVRVHASGVHYLIELTMDLESIAFTKDSTEGDAHRRIRYGAELKADENDLRIDIANSGLNYITSSGTMNGVGSGENMINTSRNYYACYAIMPANPGGSWPASIDALDYSSFTVPLEDYPDLDIYINNAHRDGVRLQHNKATDCLTIYIPMTIIAVGTWDLSSAIVPPPKDVTYNGKPYQPIYETIENNGRTLKQFLHYYYIYGTNTDPGYGYVNIIGYGKYTGSVSRFFKICYLDVPTSHPYQNAVYWATGANITKGYTGTRKGYFGISDNVTRGQVAMMLWRAAGTPEPFGNTQTFKDVPVTHSFYKAIQWAYEQGITGGYTGSKAGYFGPGDKCTRGQIVTFLWRYEGRPEPSGNTQKFKDVPTGHNFYKAIQWAYEQGITSGYSDGSFGVNRNCTRGHCVTFMYKDMVKG